MELKMEVYTPDLELLGVLEEYQSVIWEEKAFSAGSFSVEALLTEKTKELLTEENILWIGGDTAGTIEHYDKTAEDGAYITIKGRLLTGVLDKRILWGLYELSGTPPAIMRYLVDDCAVNPTRGDIEARKIPGLVLLDAPAGGEKIHIQKTGGSLLEELELIGAAYHVPFGVRFNPAVPRMEFWMRWGQDRGINQNENEHVFYSTQLDDVLSSEYSYDSTGWRNVALVAGEGEGKDRQMVVVEEDVPEPPAPPEPPEPEKFTITLTVDPAGGGIASGGGRFAGGTSVTVTAAASDGYDFAGWRENGDIVSIDLVYSFSANSDRSLTAVFSVVPVHTVSISIDPDGSGTVTGAGTYREGEMATVTAVPADGYKFVGWQENGVTHTTDATFTFEVLSDWVLVAVFEAVKVSVLPEGYTEFEYIRSLASNTLYNGNYGYQPAINGGTIRADTILKIKVYPETFPTSPSTISGTYAATYCANNIVSISVVSTNSKHLKLWISPKGIAFSIGYYSGTLQFSTIVIPNTTTSKWYDIVLDFSSKKIEVDGISYSFPVPANGNPSFTSSTIYVGNAADAKPATTAYLCNYRIGEYSIQSSVNTAAASNRHGIPAKRDSTNYISLYDLTGGTILTNYSNSSYKALWAEGPTI